MSVVEWTYQCPKRVTSIAHYPVYVENLANSPAPTGRVRETADHIEIINAVTVVIRQARQDVTIYGDAWMVKYILSAPQINEVLSEFLAFERTRLRLVVDNKGMEVTGHDMKPDFAHLDPERFRMLRREAGSVRPPMRFVITDTHSWWLNEYGNDPTNLQGAYAFRNRERPGLLPFFQRHFEFL